MPIADAESLLQALLVATTSGQVRNILEQVGDYANMELDQPFGPFQFCWHAFGNKESNLSSIGLGTRPGRSLTERLPNGMVGIREEHAPADVALPHSAGEPAQHWLGPPVSGAQDGPGTS